MLTETKLVARGKGNEVFHYLEINILIHDLGRTPQQKMPSASGEESPSSMSMLYLQLMCSSKGLEEPFLSEGVDPRFKSLESGCHLGQEEDLVWSLPRRFKGSICS